MHKRTLSLVEVVAAVFLLLVGLLGLSATFSIAQVSQTAARERQAASLAAQTKLQEIVAFADMNPGQYPTLLVTQYHQKGFHVNISPDEIGLESGAGLIPLNPASDGLFPPARAPLGGIVKQQAGFIEVDQNVDPQGVGAPRQGLSRVTITVAWRSAVGTSVAEERIVYSQLITTPY